jgi:transglutaminase-like putative cysteine protease
MRASDRNTVAVVLALFLATFTISPLTSDSSIFLSSWILIGLLGVLTLVLRRSALGSAAVLGAQLVLWAVFVLLLSATMVGEGEPWYAHVAAEWSAGIQHMQSQASPMDRNDGVKLIFVCVIGLALILTDLIVSGLKRPVWGFGPPTLIFLVPAVGLGLDTGPVSFLCVAVGYLAILVAEGLNSTSRWTRGLSRDTAEDRGSATQVVWRAAGMIGGPALVLTLLLGMLLPTFSLSGVGFGTGSGGNGPLQLADPTLDLRRNLNQPEDRKVISYTTDRPGGLYLRMASLPLFNANGWSNVPMELRSGEALSAIPGLSTEPTTRRKTTIKILDFRSEYLPLPYAPRAIDAAGNWAYDPRSLVMLAMARGNRTGAIQNLTYSVDSADVAPDSKDMADALSGTPVDADVTAEVPKDLPPELTSLTNRVIAGRKAPAERAAAIQTFLRSKQFTYSTEVLPGSGYRALVNFLTKDYTGYCEQFATSMAMMARIAGIPSRVAVGFLPGHKNGDHWDVTIHDMHAWPELYFAGLGWVRYEPTPSSITGSAPGWTTPNAADPGDSASQGPSSAPSSEASAPSLQPSEGPADQTPDSTSYSVFPWGRTLVGSGIGLVLLLVLAGPVTIRGRRRTERLGLDGPPEERVEAAWQEIRDTVLDYGGSWPEGSPRAIGGEISRGLEGEQSDTMTAVATLVERSRYAQRFTDEEATRSLPVMTHDIRRGLAQPQSRWRRVRAVLMPRSLFRRRR